jgi:hypothetical protein
VSKLKRRVLYLILDAKTNELYISKSKSAFKRFTSKRTCFIKPIIFKSDAEAMVFYNFCVADRIAFPVEEGEEDELDGSG